MHPRLRSFSILIGLVCAAPAWASADAPATGYALLARQEARVATIGFRLTTANAAWCPAIQPQFGWILGDPRLYDAYDRAEALAAYHATDADTAFVAAVAPGSPAATAGLRTGAAIGAVNGQPVDVAEGNDAFARMTALEKLFAALPPRARVMIAGIDGRAAAIDPVPGCASDFRVNARAAAAGGADGRLVVVSAGLVDFAASDDELAAAIAHELAHNILRHRARLDAAGVDRGLGKQFGRSARLFKQTEVEADRLSVWLLAGAGYDPAATVRFWSRFGQRKGAPPFQAATHPGWRDRVASFEEEIRAIDSARTAGQPLKPPLIDAPPPLE